MASTIQIVAARIPCPSSRGSLTVLHMEDWETVLDSESIVDSVVD